MSRMGCKCGHTIVDTSDSLPYKAHFVRDQDWDHHYDYHYDSNADVLTFLDAIHAGRREEWIRKYFGEGYPTNISNASLVDDIASSHKSDVECTMYQCEKCGRILIQVGASNRYASFFPDDDRGQNLFVSIRKPKDGGGTTVGNGD